MNDLQDLIAMKHGTAYTMTRHTAAGWELRAFDLKNHLQRNLSVNYRSMMQSTKFDLMRLRAIRLTLRKRRANYEETVVGSMAGVEKLRSQGWRLRHHISAGDFGF